MLYVKLKNDLDLNIKLKTEPFKRKLRRKSLGPVDRQRVLRHDAKSTIYKRKNIYKLDFIKIKHFCSVSDTIKRMKR